MCGNLDRVLLTTREQTGWTCRGKLQVWTAGLNKSAGTRAWWHVWHDHWTMNTALCRLQLRNWPRNYTWQVKFQCTKIAFEIAWNIVDFSRTTCVNYFFRFAWTRLTHTCYKHKHENCAERWNEVVLLVRRSCHYVFFRQWSSMADGYRFSTSLKTCFISYLSRRNS